MVVFGTLLLHLHCLLVLLLMLTTLLVTKCESLVLSMKLLIPTYLLLLELLLEINSLLPLLLSISQAKIIFILFEWTISVPRFGKVETVILLWEKNSLHL